METRREKSLSPVSGNRSSQQDTGTSEGPSRTSWLKKPALAQERGAKNETKGLSLCLTFVSRERRPLDSPADAATSNTALGEKAAAYTPP